MSKQRGLGRGFDALIPTEVVSAVPESNKSTARDEVLQLDPTSISPNPHQPRSQFDETELAELSTSIKEHGILQPLVVSRKNGQTYELIAGERRLRAAKLAGLEKVPAIVRSFDEQQKLELAIIENVQRSQLNPVETATAYRKLMDEFGLTLDQVANRVGRAKSTVSNVLRLLQLPSEALLAIQQGRISEAHGRAILAAPADNQATMLASIISGGLNVRQAEELAKTVSGGKVSKPQPAKPQSYAILGDYLGVNVIQKPAKKGGTLVITYKSDEELAKLTQTILRNQ